MKPSLSDVKYQDIKPTGHTAGLETDHLSPSALTENSAPKLVNLTVASTSPVEEREEVMDRSLRSVTRLH